MDDFTDRWTVIEHIIPAAHIRGFTRGVRNETTDRLRLAVKQYIPKHRTPSAGDATHIFSHGVGSSKESYEPFFDALLRHAPAVRAVWIPDIAWHGASYVLNEAVLGDSPHWADAARDLLQLVNHFQDLMPPPLIASGQSWGVFTIMQAALWHPRLFAGLLCMEPTLVASVPGQDPRKSYAFGMVFKRDTWASREEARAYLLRNPYYGAFDPAVLERVVRYDLRDVVREDGSRAVTLTTPKSMEVYTMMRPWPPLLGEPDPSEARLQALAAQGAYKPTRAIPGFHRPEVAAFWELLPQLRPPVLLVWAGPGSHRGVPGYRERLLKTLGTHPDGGGGVSAGQVDEVVVEESGHPLPLEKPALAAGAVAPWVVKMVEEYRAAAAQRKVEGPMVTKTVDPAWVERVNKL